MVTSFRDYYDDYVATCHSNMHLNGQTMQVRYHGNDCRYGTMETTAGTVPWKRLQVRHHGNDCRYGTMETTAGTAPWKRLTSKSEWLTLPYIEVT